MENVAESHMHKLVRLVTLLYTLSTPRIKKDGACTGTWELQELNQIEDMEAIRKADGHMKI